MGKHAESIVYTHCLSANNKVTRLKVTQFNCRTVAQVTPSRSFCIMSAHQLVVILLLSTVFLAKSNAAEIPKYAEYFREETLNDTAEQAKDASLSYPSSCTPFYPDMVTDSPRGFTNIFPTPYGVCASLYTGRFVAVSIAILPNFNIYTESGLIHKSGVPCS